MVFQQLLASFCLAALLLFVSPADAKESGDGAVGVASIDLEQLMPSANWRNCRAAGVRCPPKYRRIARYMTKMCQGKFKKRHLNALKEMRWDDKIGQKDLLYLFNIVGAFHGYRFKKLKWANEFFYSPRAHTWLPAGCASQMQRYNTLRQVPGKMRWWHTELSSFYKKMKRY